MADSKPAGKQTGSGLRVLLAAATVVIVMTGLRLAAELFIPIMLGLFLALLSLPILNWLDRRGLPRPLAVVSTVLIDFLILGAIVFIASGALGDFQEKSGDYTKKLRKQAGEFSRQIDDQIARLENLWRDAGEELAGVGRNAPGEPEVEVAPVEPFEQVDSVSPSSSDEGDAAPIAGRLDADITFSRLFEMYFDEQRLLSFVGQIDIVNRFTALASTTFFALIVMIFVLAESGSYAHKARDVLHVRGPDLRRFQRIANDIQKYLAVKAAVSALTGLLAMLACIVFRVDFPLLWGMVAFLLNFIPAIGSIIAAIPPVLLALLDHGFWPGMGVLGCYLVINISIGNFLEPMLLGDRFGISTVIVILSVLFWGFIWGPVGMFLAVPLTMLVKVMLDNSSDFRWISALMGKGTPDLARASSSDEGTFDDGGPERLEASALADSNL